MSDCYEYVVYDFRRKRIAAHFAVYAADWKSADELAKREFSQWYRMIVRVSRWEHRKFFRYFLQREGVRAGGRNGEIELFPVKDSDVMEDIEVRMSYTWFRMADPPNNEAEEAELEAEFDRLDGLDAARLARIANQRAA